MTFNSFDPRSLIRTTIGTAWYDVEEGSLSVVTVTDDNNQIVRIPLRLSEEVKVQSLDELPYIEMQLVSVSYEPHDIAASTRKREAYMDCHFYFTDTDNITAYDFGKEVMDALQNLVRDNHCVFGNNTNRMFVNIREVRSIPEPNAHQVVFHYVLTIYAIHYDCCE